MKCAVDDTIEYVKHLAQRLEGYTASSFVLIVLMRLGIPTNYTMQRPIKTTYEKSRKNEEIRCDQDGESI